MRKFLISIALALASVATAQGATNPACPGATGTLPHCTVLVWQAPTTGATATGYNIYTGGTSAGQCVNTSAPTCTKIGSVVGTTFTWNTTATTPVTEGTTYFFVVTSTNASGESGPSTEVSAAVPFLLPGAPTGVTAIGH